MYNIPSCLGKASSPEGGTGMPGLYKSFVDKLQTPPEFLEGYQDKISNQLSRTLQKIKKGETDESERVQGLNQLIHLASCIVLVPHQEGQVGSVLSEIRSNDSLKNYDPTTIITASYLYHLLNDPARTKGFERKDIEYMRRSLDRENWFLTSEAMESLGIERVK